MKNGQDLVTDPVFWAVIIVLLMLLGVLIAAWRTYQKDKNENDFRIKNEWPHQDWHTPPMRRAVKYWPLKDRHISKHWRGK